jgi:hypothetical protein
MANFPTIATGVPFFRAFNLIDSQAQAFYDRVIADGGIVPTGLIGVSETFKAVKAIYGVSDITSALSVFYDAHYLGYKSVISGGAGVTKSQSCEKLYSACGASGDCVQATLVSQPLLLAHGGNNYYYNPCIANNSVTSGTALGYTPLTDTLIITAKIFANNQTTASWDNIVVQNTLFGLQIQNNGTAKKIRINATTAATASSSYTPSSTNPHFVRVTITTANITYAWSADGITYTTLDSGITLPTFGTTGTLTIGGSANSTANACSTYSVICSNSTTSSTITFDAANYLASTSQTSWTGGGATWTINTGTATTGYKGVLVDRTIVQADGVDDTMVQSTANRGDICTQYAAVKYAAVTTAGASFIDAQSHASYNAISWLNSTTIRVYFENATAIDRTIVAQTLNLITITNTNAAQTGSINNGTNGTNTQNPSTSKTGVTIFANGAGGARQQGFLNTYLCSNSINNSTVRTAMYNYIRSINNNAF